MTENNSNAISEKFLVYTFCATTIILFYLLYTNENNFCSKDKMPHLLPITKEVLDKKPASVHVGISILDFSNFDIKQNKFTTNAAVWFIFNPKEISIESIEKFSFERGQIEEKSKPYSYLIGQNQLSRFFVRVSFKSDLNYSNFPFDDHKIYLSLINDTLSPEQIIFKSFKEDLKIDPIREHSGWKYVDHNVYTGYDTAKLGSNEISRIIKYPEVVFELDYNQASSRYALLIVLPLLLIFFIELFALAIDQASQRGALINLSGTDIAALFAYRFVIETLSPSTGYFMISDYLFFIFLSLSFAMLLINGYGPDLTKNQKKALSVVLQIIVILSFVYFLRIWSNC